MAETAAGLWARWEARQRTGGYSSGHRCFGCGLFVAGPTVTCGACGQLHGGGFHEAYATR